MITIRIYTFYMQKEPRQISIAPSKDDTLRRPGNSQPEHSAPKTARRLMSEDIFAGDIEVEIDHNGKLYRMRRTSLGKLILTK